MKSRNLRNFAYFYNFDMHNSKSSLIVGNFIGPSTPRFMMIPKSFCTTHMSVNYKSEATFMSIHVIKLNLKILSIKINLPKSSH